MLHPEMAVLSDQLKTCHGDNLLSLIAYTPLLKQVPSLILILNKIQSADLEKQAAVMRSFLKKTPVPITLFTPDEFSSAQDVFPMEFLDMKRQYTVLAGTDVLATLSFEPVHLRHECEFYLRSHLLKIREGLVMDAKQGGELIQQSFPAILNTLAHIISLSNKHAAFHVESIIRVAQDKLKISLDVFKTIAKLKTPKDMAPHMDAYLKAIQTLIVLVDKL